MKPKTGSEQEISAHQPSDRFQHISVLQQTLPLINPPNLVKCRSLSGIGNLEFKQRIPLIGSFILKPSHQLYCLSACTVVLILKMATFIVSHYA